MPAPPLKILHPKSFFPRPQSLPALRKWKKQALSPGIMPRSITCFLVIHIKAFINLEVEPYQKKEFYPFIQAIPNVIECNCVTGDYAMLIEVAFQTTIELDHFINELQHFGRTKTLIVFSTSVEHRDVPVV